MVRPGAFLKNANQQSTLCPRCVCLSTVDFTSTRKCVVFNLMLYIYNIIIKNKI